MHQLINVSAGRVTAILLTLGIGLAIKLESRGPVLFRQRRIGLNGREFWLYKFRSMCDGAEALQPALEHQNEMGGGPAHPGYRARRLQPRLQPTGRVERRPWRVERRYWFLIGRLNPGRTAAIGWRGRARQHRQFGRLQRDLEVGARQCRRCRHGRDHAEL